MLGPLLQDGPLVIKEGHSGPTRTIRLLEVSYLLPDQHGLEAGEALGQLLENADQDTLIFCLLSGGGSALLVELAPGLTLAGKQKTTSLLLACGADIGEINAVRKRLSRLKGGGLARLAAPATLISLIVSDVVGDPLNVIAFSPTCPTPPSGPMCGGECCGITTCCTGCPRWCASAWK